MSSRNATLPIAAIAVLMIVSVGSGVHAQTATNSSPSILVLRSGQVLRGEISPLGPRYIVRQGPGNELRIAASDVEFHCANLTEAYEKKRGQLAPGKIESRWELVEWCLRQELLPQAAEQLTIALRIEPNHPRTLALERRLQLATTRVTATPPEPATAPPVIPSSLEDLERANRELPHGSVEFFTSSVQPLLLNRCASNACHGPSSSSDYHLLRPGVGITAGRRFTLRNLHATLAYVDREDPEQSRLLAALRDPHGPNQLKLFSPTEHAQYEQLAAWVRQVSRPREIPPPSTISAQTKHAAHATRWPGAVSATTETEGTTAEGQEVKPKGRLRQRGAGSPNAPAASDSSGGSALENQPAGIPSGAASDPFDPEIFNRRHFPDAGQPTREK